MAVNGPPSVRFFGNPGDGEGNQIHSQILLGLPRNEFDKLSPKLEFVRLKTHHVLHEPRTDTPELLVSALSVEFESDLRGIYSRSRTLDEVTREIAAAPREPRLLASNGSLARPVIYGDAPYLGQQTFDIPPMSNTRETTFKEGLLDPETGKLDLVVDGDAVGK